MNAVKDFTLGQRVATTDGDGEITKIGRKYVYVKVDGADKPGQYLPEDLTAPLPESERSVVEPVAPESVDYLPLMATPGKSLVLVPDETHGLLGGPLHNAASCDARPPMRLKGKRADADNRRAARKAQRRSRRANRR